MATPTQLAVGILVPAFTSVGLYWYTGSVEGAGLPTRLLSVIVPFVFVLPVMLVFRLITNPARHAAAQQDEINRLEAVISARSKRSDLILTLNPDYTVEYYPDEPAIERRSLVVTNRGKTQATNCILKLTVEPTQPDMGDPMPSTEDASAPFNLRCGESKILPLISISHEQASMVWPERYINGRSRRDTPDAPCDALSALDNYYLKCEVLSGNTAPARLTLKLRDGATRWVLDPIEEASMEAV